MIYRAVIAIRHFFYDRGWKKSVAPEVPSIVIGNITVGGTGKTPHTELISKLLIKSEDWAFKNIAVLSRGYKRKSSGFQKVPREGSARLYGDEPVQIARKLPAVTVAVDKNRVRGCHILAHPDEAPKKCKDKDFQAAQLIILDDAFQYRKLKASANIVLVDYNRPINEDHLMPWGRLRDLPSRIKKADIVIVTKCPDWLDEESKLEWRKKLKLGDGQKLFFTTISYGQARPVFQEGDPHYIYSQRLVLVSGIANDAPLRSYLSDSYKIIRYLKYRDHHKFSVGDVRDMAAAVRENPTACVMTTEKDAQRMYDVKPSRVPDNLRKRMFYLPIEASFLSPEEELAFTEAVSSALK